jgi:hypothetical protein
MFCISVIWFILTITEEENIFQTQAILQCTQQGLDTWVVKNIKENLLLGVVALGVGMRALACHGPMLRINCFASQPQSVPSLPDPKNPLYPAPTTPVSILTNRR